MTLLSNCLVNGPPEAVDDEYTTPEDTPISDDVSTNDPADPDGDDVTVKHNTNPSNGAVVMNPDGTFTYTPNENFNGVDTFEYTVTDGNGGEDTATVTITIAASIIAI